MQSSDDRSKPDNENGSPSLLARWLGRTTLRGVKLALPLSDQSFVDVPEMRVRHTGLIAMIFGRPLLIKEVALEKPVIYVRQDSAGRWNIQEVAELIAYLCSDAAAGVTGQAMHIDGGSYQA